MVNSPAMEPFTELVRVIRPPKKIKRSEYMGYFEGAVPVVDQGEGLVGGYTDDTDALVRESDPVVVFGDHTCRFKYIDFPFSAGADGTQIFKGVEGVRTRYLYYACLVIGVDLYGYQRHFKHLKASLIPLHEESTQLKIVQTLSAYDDLIENNKRRIGILEEIARRLYEEWFVHFRFPGHEEARFKESELGRIPEGWDVTSVKPLIRRLKNGTIYKQKDVEESGSTIVIDQSRSEYLGFHSNEPDHQASDKKPIIIFGDHTCKMQIMVTPFSLGPNTIAFTGKTEHSLYYIFSLVKGLIKTQEYKRHWSDFMDKTIVAAPVGLSLQYAETVEPMFGHIEVLRRKIRNLRAQRDLLLPKLVSGQIDVSDIPIPNDKQVDAE